MKDHPLIIELLPWFVNDSLSERERQKVQSHLLVCAQCQSERDALQQLQVNIIESGDGTNPDYRFAYRKLSDRIDAHEANRSTVAGFDSPRRDAVWGYLGAAACLVVAVLLLGLWNTSAPDQPDPYRTLSSSTPVAGTAHRVALTFEAPIRAETLRATLIETDANLVSGPNAEGTYLLEIHIPKGMTDDEFIQSMSAISGVKYAAFQTDLDDVPAR